jgi:hypothetical protein
MRVRPRSHLGSTTVRETVPHIYRHTHTFYLYLICSVPAIVLRLVIDVVRVQNGVGDAGHEAVHPPAPVLVRPRDVVQGLRNVEEDVVDAVEDHRGLRGQQRGQGQRQQLTPERKKSVCTVLAMLHKVSPDFNRYGSSDSSGLDPLLEKRTCTIRQFYIYKKDNICTRDSVVLYMLHLSLVNEPKQKGSLVEKLRTFYSLFKHWI